MYSKIFGKAVCVKPWSGSNAIRKATKERIATIPETDLVIAARFGRLKDPETGKLHLDIKDPLEIVKLITERGWDDLPFEDLAKKLRTLHENVPDAVKASLAESEIYLLQPNGKEDTKKAPTRKPEETASPLQGIFQKSACVKSWEGPKHAQRAATTRYALVPSTNFMIAAKFGNITDNKSGKRINAKDPEYLAKHIVNQGWEELPFEELADKLIELHRHLKKSNIFSFDESEIHLLQTHGTTEAEKRIPIRKLG